MNLRVSRPKWAALAATGALSAVVVAVVVSGCTTVDPGPDFVIPVQSFNANYFYCHLEPDLILGKHCGDLTSSCHYNPSAVSGMVLQMHPAIDCGGGEAPVDPTTVATGSPAEANLEAVSLDMDHTYTSAEIYTRPTGMTSGHQVIFSTSDPVVADIMTWASLQ